MNMKKFLFVILLLSSELMLAEYKNTNGVASDKSFGDMLKWIRSDIEPVITKIELSSEWQNLNFSKDDNYAIWIGHSTFLIKKNGVTILTDPIFSKRASPFRNIGPKRLIPPAIPLDELPSIDIVTVSHNHYDHLDIRSLKKLSKNNPQAIFLVPAGDEKLLKRKKIRNVYAFDWWKSIEHKGFEITFTPVQHWSKRSLFDRNKSLWGGWFFKHKDYSLYHAGDTGYSKDFIDTKIKLGSPKYAFIPIGAYDPEWFMAESHVNPEDAVQIMIDLEAEKSFGMHWATFVLTDEDTIEPKIRLEKAMMEHKNLEFTPVVPGSIINLE